uniref:SAM pointed domain containing ETS transcription factor n=1 Tax=Oryzias sinensis TaxID=183150 RepID=A0A8C7YL13_9TELE
LESQGRRLSEGAVYGPRIGLTENSLTLMERSRGSGEQWDLGETKPNMEALERGGLYFSCFDMLFTEDAAWLVKLSEASPALALPMTRMESREEPEQCPVIDSQEQGLSPELERQVEERSLEQVQSMVVGEVLKDIETACKLLNITPGMLVCTTPAATISHFQELPGIINELWSEADSSCSGQPIHLWQFLRELLLKPHNYGRCIRWLNKEKGIFKIEDSAHVARLWGLRKNRPAMNYDKLSRSIRQYYKKGIIRKPDVSQRLVYQFVHPV